MRSLLGSRACTASAASHAAARLCSECFSGLRLAKGVVASPALRHLEFRARPSTASRPNYAKATTRAPSSGPSQGARASSGVPTSQAEETRADTPRTGTPGAAPGGAAGAAPGAAPPSLVGSFIDFLNEAWTQFHATARAKEMLLAAGFKQLNEGDDWDVQPGGRYFLTRNMSTIIAFAVGNRFKVGEGVRIIAAHTDSPCLKLKPVSAISKQGYMCVGVQPYGGGLWYTWFDRDLSVAGRVIHYSNSEGGEVEEGRIQGEGAVGSEEEGVEERKEEGGSEEGRVEVGRKKGFLKHSLVKIEEAIMRIPTLAIHLDRNVNSEGFKPNLETHVVPVLATSIKAKLWNSHHPSPSPNPSSSNPRPTASSPSTPSTPSTSLSSSSSSTPSSSSTLSNSLAASDSSASSDSSYSSSSQADSVETSNAAEASNELNTEKAQHSNGAAAKGNKFSSALGSLGAQDSDHHPALLQLVARQLGLESPQQIVDFELNVCDTQPSCLGGAFGEFIFSGRLDNLACSYIALESLIQSCPSLEDETGIRCIALFDNEEVGSESAVGAASPSLYNTLSRVLTSLAYSADPRPPHQLHHAVERSFKKSFLVSADMAHGIHPNYPERHEERHQPRLHSGFVIKHNANQRYATNLISSVLFKQLAIKHGIPCQSFVVRNDMGCGSTVGPILASALGIRTVDVGLPQLSMHSIREMCATDDIDYGFRHFMAFFSSDFQDLDRQLEVDN